MATRKKKGSGGSPVGWFLGGLVIGLGTAVFLFTRGFMPAGPERPVEDPPMTGRDEAPLLEESSTPEETGYDFFTVLPEMEVVVPERELSDQASPDAPPPPAGDGDQRFVLQAGSFRSAADADQMKAQLALLGAVANVQTVNVDGETWHRVRVGPVQGARAADQLRRQLQDNGIDVLVLKDSG